MESQGGRQLHQLQGLKNYADDSGNAVVYDGESPADGSVSITFRGSGNLLKVARGAKIVHLAVDFSGNDGVIEIGATTKPRTGLRFSIRIGHECTVAIGDNVGCETRTFIRASEGASVSIGEDCMFASAIELRADDSHAIYDVRTGKRANPARSIHIGEHVWLGKSVVVMAGVTIGSGSVVGFRSVVTRDIPNNCVAAGSPARVVRRDIAWERPLLSYRRPGIEGLAKGEQKSERWWALTEEPTSTP